MLARWQLGDQGIRVRQLHGQAPLVLYMVASSVWAICMRTALPLMIPISRMYSPCTGPDPACLRESDQTTPPQQAAGRLWKAVKLGVVGEVVLDSVAHKCVL